MMRSHRILIRARAAALALLIFAAPASAADDPAAGEFTLGVADGLLSLAANGASLVEIIRALGDAAGFETELRGEVAVPVTASLTRVPVARAVERLLSRANVIFVSEVREGGHGEPEIGRLILLGAGPVTGEAVTVRGEAMADEEPAMAGERAYANAILGLANAEDTRDSLERLSETAWADPVALARSRAAMALGALGDDRAVPALELALSDSEPSVRTQAIHALGQIGGEPAVRALGDVLLRESYGRTERMRAALALGQLGGELAHGYLSVAAGDPDPLISAAATHPPLSAARGSRDAGREEKRGSRFMR